MSANKVSICELFAKFKPAAGDCYLGWRLTSIVLAGIIVAGGLFTAIFVYKNIYSTISNSHIIFALNTKLSADAVDMDAYDRIYGKISAKKSITEIPAGLRNIFDYNLPTVASTTKK